MAQSRSLIREPLTSVVMVDSNLGKHCVVLNLGLAKWGAIVGDYYQLPCISPTNKTQIFKILFKKKLKKEKCNRIERIKNISTTFYTIKEEPFELRRDRRTVLKPRVNLPLFMTRASLLFMLSWVFFCAYGIQYLVNTLKPIKTKVVDFPIDIEIERYRLLRRNHFRCWCSNAMKSGVESVKKEDAVLAVCGDC